MLLSPTHESCWTMSASQFGAATFSDGTNDFNTMDFVARRVLAGAVIATLVQVKAVNGNTVNAQPLVNQVDGLGNATPHGIINNLRWIQLQGGPCAILIPPVVGDIGLAVFADRDISSVVANKGQANPGSWRRNDYADGVYVTCISGINETPSESIELTSAGINITTPGGFSITSPDVTTSGNLEVGSGVSATFATLDGHTATFQQGILIGYA
jgi:hypothetical protein